ncbi:hypothetical protein JTE90_026564 [Oedothorax gibbosus]|uniref:Uncharacterized protein n=1 Tax=Oedothorax gibbosus TaxID=931172 RepID=A0AAV6U1K4_9ARAC|nr:hypothetical protein JTE90_026564 [Oedothorax gibbosus]
MKLVILLLVLPCFVRASKEQCSNVENAAPTRTAVRLKMVFAVKKKAAVNRVTSAVVAAAVQHPIGAVKIKRFAVLMEESAAVNTVVV